jgi:putative PIN family toxin of toxin-antitoxin system
LLRAVLDANVLVSAAIQPSGPPGQIIAELLTRQAFQMIVSPAIAAEIEDALRQPKIRKYLHEPDEAALWVADLMAVADVVADSGFNAGVCRDPDDEVLLAAAVEGRAEMIVTGDSDLLVLGEYEGIAIVRPRTFLDFIKG